MSLDLCIPDLVESGQITPERAARVNAKYQKLVAHYRNQMGEAAAKAEASARTIEQLSAEAAAKKRQMLLQDAAQAAAERDMGAFRGKGDYAAIRGMMTNDVNAPFDNVELKAQAIEFRAHAMIREFIERHRRNFLGKASDKAGLIDMVRARHGDAIDNPNAKAFSDAIGEVFEMMRLRANAAGATIGKLDNYFPHKWSTAKVRAVEFERFREIMEPELDLTRMRNALTGGEMTADDIGEALRAVWETIRSGGLTGEPSAAFRGAGALANRLGEHRFLHFKDGDAWLRVHEAFGEGDPFTAVMGHIGGMARQIAMMERFGPNPDATVRFLLDKADRAEAQGGAKVSTAALGMSGGRKLTDTLWRYMKGEMNVPVVPENWLQGPPPIVTSAIAGTRNLLTSALLGSAPLSAISDGNTIRMARAFNGMPQTGVLWGYLKQLNPASGKHRQLAIRLGLGMRDASQTMMMAHRYLGDLDDTGWTAVVADDVLRLSGLNKMTEAGQRLFGVDMLGELADHRSGGWDALPQGIRTAMERYGLDAAAWDKIRAAEPERMGGGEWVNAANIEDRAVAERLMQWVLGETQAAVQEQATLVRAVTASAGQPGTWLREGVANSLQFKGFAASIVLTQGQRIASLPRGQAVRYAANFFIGMTLFGAASIQLREIAKGRDPRPMDNWEFWADAVLQGGGLGIFGDLIGSFSNERIGGWAEFLAGPFGGVIADVKRARDMALPGDEREDGTRREANPGGAALYLAKRYTPGTSLWWARAAYERWIIDSAAEWADPDVHERRERAVRRAAQQGQGFWWQSGDWWPERAPDFANAWGGSEEPEAP